MIDNWPMQIDTTFNINIEIDHTGNKVGESQKYK